MQVACKIQNEGWTATVPKEVAQVAASELDPDVTCNWRGPGLTITIEIGISTRAKAAMAHHTARQEKAMSSGPATRGARKPAALYPEAKTAVANGSLESKYCDANAM